MDLSRTSLATLALLLLAGCQTSPVARTPAAPALQLMAAEPLQLADGCQPSSSIAVDFTVLADGSTSAIKTPAVADCVHDALTAWVASFRYAPPGVAVPGTVEWLLVSAKKVTGT